LKYLEIIKWYNKGKFDVEEVDDEIKIGDPVRLIKKEQSFFAFRFMDSDLCKLEFIVDGIKTVEYPVGQFHVLKKIKSYEIFRGYKMVQ
jgi:hypothetical protein